MHAHESSAVPVAVELERDHERAHKHTALGILLGGVAAIIFALAVLIYVLWGVGASTKATPFDADGVRCYRAASEMSCIKTAEPAR